MLDLTNDAALTRVLLYDTRAWRQRLVEHLLFASSDTVHITSSYQVEVTSGLLESVGLLDEPTDAIRCILPITTRPKTSLLGFGVTGPDGAPARLLLRRDIAAIEAGLLAELWESEPHAASTLPVEFVEAIVGFHAGRFRRTHGNKLSSARGIAAYLSVRLPFPVETSWVQDWIDRSVDAGTVLRTTLDEPADPFSAAEQPLLALAEVEPTPQDRATADRLLNEYLHAVQAAARAGNAPFLTALAEYGKRWEVLLETELPLDQPTVMRLTEDRLLDLNWYRRTHVQLAVGDAWSYHLEARVSDHAVALAGVQYLDPQGRRVPDAILEDRRQRPDSLALYTSIWPDAGHATLRLRLRADEDQRLAGAVVALLTLMALGAALIGNFQGRTEEAMAFLSVPTTFAAALVLTRHESPLAARLQRGLRRTLAFLIVTLWVVAIGKVAAAESMHQPGEIPRPTFTSRVTVTVTGEGRNHGQERGSR